MHSIRACVTHPALLSFILLAGLGCSASGEPLPSGPLAGGGAGSVSAGGSGGVPASGGTTTLTGGATQSGGASMSGSSTAGFGGAPNGGGASFGGTSAGGIAAGGSSAGGSSAGGNSAAGGAATNGGSPNVNGGSPSASGGVSSGGSATSGGAAGKGGGASGGSSNGSTVCVAKTAVATMKLGWNLGNSLDSVDRSKSDVLVETAWGNPAVTPELIAKVADSGFGVVRIPVTWIDRMGPAPDYTISPAFIQRVEQVVQYVLDRGMYAIINTHHDGSEGVAGQWISLVDSAGQPSAANNQRVEAQFKKVWTQIAAHFKGYGDRLIFESMNEIKVGYNTPPKAHLDQVNVLNQIFVDTVRASGGNNAGRCLVVPGYNTNIDHTVTGFTAPKDTSEGKLILSAHYYDPWSFAGAATTHAWGARNPGIDTWGQEDWVRGQVAKLKTNYIDKGLPVIWGEYGAANQAGYEKYVRYYMEYVTKAVHDAGIVPIIWDRGATNSGEDAFGLFNRANNTVQFPYILEAMQKAVTSNYILDQVAKP